MSKSVFITGIAGQDGSILANKLVSAGLNVHGLVLQDEPIDLIDDIHDKITIHKGNLIDYSEIDDLVNKICPGIIYNLGGISSVAFSWKNPVATAEITGVGAINLMESAFGLHKKGNSIHFIQASSSEIFGNANTAPQNELTSFSPVSPYGNAKLLAHNAANMYRKQGLNISSIILFPHESLCRPNTFVTRKITSTVAKIKLGLESVLELGNIDARRDWGYAPDYVDAMIAASELDYESSGDFVLATGETHTVEDFVRFAFSSIGINDYTKYIRINPDFVRPLDPALSRGDASKARSVLRFRNTKKLEELVSEMVQHDLELLTEA